MAVVIAKRRAPALVGGLILATFIVVEGRLRKGAEARSFSAEGTDGHTTRDVGVAFGMSALGCPLVAESRIGRLSLPYAWAGVGFMGVGLGLRVRAAQTLGEYYTRTLRTAEDQAVVDAGLYRFVRHPGYLGVLTMWLGYGLAASSGPAAIGAVAVNGVAYSRRIRTEEEMLVKALPDYVAYQRRTSRLIPGVW